MSSDYKVISASIEVPDSVLAASAEIPSKVKEITAEIPSRVILGSAVAVGERGEKGDKGDAFKYEDFTVGQLEAIRDSVVTKISRQSLSDDEIIDLV